MADMIINMIKKLLVINYFLTQIPALLYLFKGITVKGLLWLYKRKVIQKNLVLSTLSPFSLIALPNDH